MIHPFARAACVARALTTSTLAACDDPPVPRGILFVGESPALSAAQSHSGWHWQPASEWQRHQRHSRRPGVTALALTAVPLAAQLRVQRAAPDGKQAAMHPTLPPVLVNTTGTLTTDRRWG